MMVKVAAIFFSVSIKSRNTGKSGDHRLRKNGGKFILTFLQKICKHPIFLVAVF